MRSYVFAIRVEPDEYDDGTPALHAACDALKVYAQGDTFEEALANIQSLVTFELECRLRNGEDIPTGLTGEAMVFPTPTVVVNL